MGTTDSRTTDSRRSVSVAPDAIQELIGPKVTLIFRPGESKTYHRSSSTPFGSECGGLTFRNETPYFQIYKKHDDRERYSVFSAAISIFGRRGSLTINDRACTEKVGVTGTITELNISEREMRTPGVLWGYYTSTIYTIETVIDRKVYKFSSNEKPFHFREYHPV